MMNKQTTVESLWSAPAEFIIRHSPFFLPRPSLRYAASALSGVLLFACFPRLDWNLLVWLACLPLLVAVVSEPQLGRAYLLGAVAGVIFLAGSVYWFVGVMEEYGRLSPALAVGAMIPFLILFSSFWGVFGLLESWVARRSIGLALMLSPFLWVALEWARTYYFVTGFPWNLLGYAVRSAGLRQLASVTAVYGLSFLAVASSALIAAVLLGPRRPLRKSLRFGLPVWAVSLFVANRVLQPAPLPPRSNLALLVQPNVPLNERAYDWAPWRDPRPLEHLIDLSLASLPPPGNDSASPLLIIWSENSAPFIFNRDPIFRTAVENMARQAHGYVIVGATNFAGDEKPRESADVLSPDGNLILQYDKIHLVPFGEYVPSWLSGYAGKITSQVGDFVPGSTYSAAQTSEGKIGVFICYEAIFPQLVRRLTPKGAGVLVNISDDAWYGDSAAADQHLEMARLRAIESHRFLLRATNDGITAVIDPYGRVMEQLPRHRSMVLPGYFSYLAEQTFYTAHGDVFAGSCLSVSLALLALRKARLGRY